MSTLDSRISQEDKSIAWKKRERSKWKEFQAKIEIFLNEAYFNLKLGETFFTNLEKINKELIEREFANIEQASDLGKKVQRR